MIIFQKISNVAFDAKPFFLLLILLFSNFSTHATSFSHFLVGSFQKTYFGEKYYEILLEKYLRENFFGYGHVSFCCSRKRYVWHIHVHHQLILFLLNFSLFMSLNILKFQKYAFKWWRFVVRGRVGKKTERSHRPEIFDKFLI